ncbi:MAG TPA: multicopper oxidase domain-containing protein, partial [Saprospiraceae bacterium]|nr:multicopper oxidase domain-containing protein [Saprospiraceae bacterium]
VFVYYCIPHGADNGDGTASGMASTVTVLPAGSGACCLPDGMCITADEGGCLSQGGIFSGVGTSCDTTYCAVTMEIVADQDNILYESATGDISNGMGIYLYTGNNTAGRRRTVVSFDLSSIPEGAEVEDVELKLFCNSSSGSAFPITAQRLLQDWGEGNSDASGNEANGAPAEPGDATWIHSFFNTNTWMTQGGTFSPTISATTNVDVQNSFYTWSSSQMNLDVAHWLQMPAENFGWVMRGDEATTNNTKRFSSRQNATSANHPRLVVHYVVPPRGACCMVDGSCQDLTANQCMAEGGDYQGDGTSCDDVTCSIQLTPYLDPLPLPGVAVPESGISGGAAHYRMEMTEQFQQLHSQLPPTRVWGYNGSYPGPTIEAFRDSMVTVQWVNNLRVVETGQLRTSHVLTIDTCLHGPNVSGLTPVAIAHLHGGKVAPHSDGDPDDAFPPGDSSGIYYYPNIQPAGILWYHDHALGITRLNVMMGLAGLYMLRDSHELSLDLPSGEYEIPLVIQDKSFLPDGSIMYHEMFHDHFFGNMLMVNGKVWPYLNVRQGKYRFRVVNGSNSRAYTLALSNGASFAQIGSELGLLETPVILDSLTVLPGERYDLVVDFSVYAAGTEIILTNSAPAPFPGFAGVGVIPNVMKFIVQNEAGYTAPLPDTLAMVEELLPEYADEERLFELMTMAAPPCGEHNHTMWTINGLMWDDITEFPVLGSTEIWTWHNQSGIAHPMHMHLVAFQILDRQAINEVSGEPEGPIIQPGESEKGWKDTANSPPGFRTRVIARFDGFTGLYPYHCHILEHEDHEMMRQFEVRPCILVTDSLGSGPGSLPYAIECAQAGDTIYFDPSIAGKTINLQDTLRIDKDVTILNTHAGTITISGQNTLYSIVISQEANVSMGHINLISGSGNSGRAVVNYGYLTLEGVTIFDSVVEAQTGDVILNQGLLMIRGNCQIL